MQGGFGLLSLGLFHAQRIHHRIEGFGEKTDLIPEPNRHGDRAIAHIHLPHAFQQRIERLDETDVEEPRKSGGDQQTDENEIRERREQLVQMASKIEVIVLDQSG